MIAEAPSQKTSSQARETVSVTKPRICFVYAGGGGHSGQRFATELLITALSDEMDSTVIELPTLAREKWARLKFLSTLWRAWFQSIVKARAASIFHFTVGQTWVSLTRDAVPVLAVRLLNRSAKIVFSLNGHLFTQWEPGSIKARLFRQLFNRADIVTVVGPYQKKVMTERLRVTRPDVRIVDNSCDFRPISDATLLQKHSDREPLRLLHLSNLLESKGFPLYVEALELLANKPGPKINACLAGDFIIDPFRQRFATQTEAEEWLNSAIARINRSQRVSVEWMRQAKGAAKQELFEKAHIFVFPSSYPVEAQPIVLLESLASGCAIICSSAGEILSTVNEKTACILSGSDSTEITATIERLASSEVRLALTREGARLFAQRFVIHQHLNQWRTLLASL